MKKTIVISALTVLASLSLYAQGTVTFGNNTATRVFQADGTTAVAGSAGYRAELVYAPDGTALDQFEAVAVRLGGDTVIGTPVAGLYSGGGRTAPTTTPGGFGLFQVRVWEVADGADWRSVKALGRSTDFIGESAIMRVDTADPTTIPPGTPTPLAGNGLTAITLHPVPEPSVIGLGVLGAGALLLLRRRK